MSLSNLLIIFFVIVYGAVSVINPLGNGFVVNGFFTNLDPSTTESCYSEADLNFIMIGVGTLVIGLFLFLLIFGLAIPVIQLGGLE